MSANIVAIIDFAVAAWGLIALLFVLDDLGNRWAARRLAKRRLRLHQAQVAAALAAKAEKAKGKRKSTQRYNILCERAKEATTAALEAGA